MSWTPTAWRSTIYYFTKKSTTLWSLPNRLVPKDKKETDPNDQARYRTLLQSWVDETKKYKQDKAKFFRILMRLCTSPLKNKIKTVDGFAEIQKSNEVLKLLSIIKDLAHDSTDTEYEYAAIQRLLFNFLSISASRPTRTLFNTVSVSLVKSKY